MNANSASPGPTGSVGSQRGNSLVCKHQKSWPQLGKTDSNLSKGIILTLWFMPPLRILLTSKWIKHISEYWAECGDQM